MASRNSDLSIQSLRGGMNDTDNPTALQDDQCVLAENVEFFSSALGERRNGCGPVIITSSNLTDETIIAHLSQWYPTNDVLDPEWIAIGLTPLTSTTIAKRTSGTWSEITPIDTIDVSTLNEPYEVVAQPLNGKDFFAYRSTQDRLHIWDGTNWRRTSLTEPAAPTAANFGAGTYSGVRYFRVRYTVQSAGTTLRRSEPSPSLAFTPSGTGSAARITKPAAINEGETHWEIEASVDDATFYLLTTLAVGTTTYDDTTVFATGYSTGDLSEAVGAYLTLPSARFLAVDGDRLIGAGHWTDTSQQATVWWTPVHADPGVGNDERLPIVDTGGTSINNTVSLDNFDGGPITGLCASANGTWYVFKWSAIYKMVRTGDAIRAYDVITVSKPNASSPGRGAIPGSIVLGIDENGAACIYFLDPVAGPSRVGAGGVETIVGLRGTWLRTNLEATSVIARGCYYPYKQQVHWWIAVDGSNRPALKLVLQVSELKRQDSVGGGGVGRGWSIATGTIAQATAVSIMTEAVSINGVTSTSNRPFIGLTSPDYIQRCDTESTDAGDAYVATIRTKPFIISGLLNNSGAMTGAILATANADVSIDVRLIKDLGSETKEVESVSLAPAGTETYVVKRLDNLAISEATMVQLEYGD